MTEQTCMCGHSSSWHLDDPLVGNGSGNSAGRCRWNATDASGDWRELHPCGCQAFVSQAAPECGVPETPYKVEHREAAQARRFAAEDLWTAQRNYDSELANAGQALKLKQERLAVCQARLDNAVAALAKES